MNNFKKLIITILLLFSVSCSVDDKTGNGDGGNKDGNDGVNKGGNNSKSELVGTWKISLLEGELEEGNFHIADNGNVIHTISLHKAFPTYTNYFFGKVADTFDYPYTIEVMVTNNKKQDIVQHGGTITFDSASKGSCNYTNLNLYPGTEPPNYETIYKGSLTK